MPLHMRCYISWFLHCHYEGIWTPIWLECLKQIIQHSHPRFIIIFLETRCDYVFIVPLIEHLKGVQRELK